MATKTAQALGLEFGAPLGEGNWNVWMDGNLVKIDSTAQISVVNRTTTIPPAIVNGERYIVATGATGAWLAKDGQLAVAVDSSWQFYPLIRGWVIEDQTDGYLYVWNGSAFVKQAKDSDVTAEAAARAAADSALDLRVDALEAASNQASLQFKDEGSNLGTAGTVTSIDFVGSGVTATRVGNAVTVTIAGGGGGGNLTANTTINVPADYATLGAALTYAQTLVPVNGAVLTITIDDTETLTEQITIANVDLSFVKINGLGTGPTIDATGWVASPFGPTPWLTVQLAKLGAIVGTFQATAATSATAILNIGGETMFGGAGEPLVIGAGFQNAVAAFLDARHKTYGATLSVLAYVYNLTTGAHVASAASTYTGAVEAGSGGFCGTESDTWVGSAALSNKALVAVQGGEVSVKLSTITGRLVAESGGKVCGQITSLSEVVGGMSDFLNAASAGEISVSIDDVAPLSGSSAAFAVAASASQINVNGSNNAVIQTSTGDVATVTGGSMFRMTGPQIDASFAGYSQALYTATTNGQIIV